MEDELAIHTKICSHYQVFDASGQLPFSIVFGLCRRSKADTNPQNLVLDVSGSALDVPYALTHGLLTIHEEGSGDTEMAEVNLGHLEKVKAKESEFVYLPSPVDRKEHYLDSFTIYHAQIDAGSELAKMLKPGKRYVIKMASKDLGVERWSYSNGSGEQATVENSSISHSSSPMKLVNSKPTAGNAKFRVVNSLPWPPTVDTTISLYEVSENTGCATENARQDNNNNRTFLKVCCTNTSSESISLQTRGSQRFLVPWGPFQPESNFLDGQITILDARPSLSSLLISDSATKNNVRRNEECSRSPLISSRADQRPKLGDVIILKPGVRFVREIDVTKRLERLEDGLYTVQIQPEGYRWWRGEVERQPDESEDERVPAHLLEIVTVPLILRSRNNVELRISNGRIDFISSI